LKRHTWGATAFGRRRGGPTRDADRTRVLLERTLTLSFDRLGSGSQMLPFALVLGPGNATECLTIVTDRSDKAGYLGRWPGTRESFDGTRVRSLQGKRSSARQVRPA
jgi:hypothetical protein